MLLFRHFFLVAAFDATSVFLIKLAVAFLKRAPHYFCFLTVTLGLELCLQCGREVCARVTAEGKHASASGLQVASAPPNVIRCSRRCSC